MKLTKLWIVSAAVAVLGVAGHAQQQAVSPPTSPPASPATLAVRLLPDGTSSLLLLVSQVPRPADEIRIDLPGAASRTAVLMSGPAGWTLERDGNAAKLAGMAAALPMRARITLFDVKELREARLRIRGGGQDLFDQRVPIAMLPALAPAGPPAGLLAFPPVVSPGGRIEMTVLSPARTPDDGQWMIAGVAASRVGPNALGVQLPADLEPGSPLRITYFDVWGERIIEALGADDTIVTDASPATTPRITACATFGFIGQSLCVCGDFPDEAYRGLLLDGQPATILSASRHAVQISLPASLAPGSHTVTGDSARTFDAADSAAFVAIRVQGSIDSAALLRGQSTTLRLGVEGSSNPMNLMITNRTPWVVSIPGGNRQDVATSGGAANSVELRVNATGKGDFNIDYRLEGPLCPCQEPAAGPSTASRPAPLVVPRRVLATITAAAPAVMLATAQAVAIANGLALVDLVPLPAAGVALAVFEVTDGLAAIAKAAALAADPRVTLAQPDFVYDTSQAGSAAPKQAPIAYGLPMIGADVAQRVSRGDGIRVGIVDTGIDTGHEGLVKKVAEYADVTGTGWTPDAHGTLVAGVIAGERSGDGGYAGVAPGVQLVAVKSCVSSAPGRTAARCWSSTLARGIDLAIQKNVRVMNLSVGGPEDRLLARMVEAAAKQGIAVVSAAGNDGPAGKPSYPAAIDNVIAVTAVDAASRLYAQATRGAFIDLAAPGVDVVSTGPGGKTQLFSGTSAATAFASGAVALLLRQRPSLTQAELTTILRDTAKDLGPAGRDPEFGYGLLDVCGALARLSKSVACQ